MTAPNIKARLKNVRKVVVIDPRRTESARLADEHLFIRPGTDALLLLSLIEVVFADDRVCTARLTPHLTGLDTLREVATGFPPERTAPVTGIAPDRVRALARELAGTPRAVVYGRVGVCTQEFGGLAAWLTVALNVLTGHLDEPGGAMFTTPAVDALPMLSLAGQQGGFGRYRTRVRGLPEFGGEFPCAALAEEIDTPGDGRIRGLITSAGNPVLSTPNGPRLERALDTLDFMVAIDPYLNETTRHADVILPPTVHLERSHYALALANYAVRNTAKYSPAVFPRAADQRHDWEIVLELASRVLGGGLPARLLGGLGPESLLELAARRTVRRPQTPQRTQPGQAETAAARRRPGAPATAAARQTRYPRQEDPPRATRVPRRPAAPAHPPRPRAERSGADRTQAGAQ
ncbi:molybdopterin-dependent oxidoreductase [Prauserella oleivorans]